MNSGDMDEGASPESTLEKLAYQFGRTYDSYLATEAGLTQFWSSSGNGVVSYAQIGRYLHVQGGLLCNPADRESLLREFHAFVRQQRYCVTFYSVVEDDLPLFRQCDFQVTKWGEEPMLDLANLTWAGGEFEWVRRQFNFCHRQNVSLTECRRENHSQAEWDALLDDIRAVAAEGLKSKPQRREIWFFNGRFDPKDWGRRRLFLARGDSGHGRIEGFLVCLPFENGSHWAVETYRHRLDAPRGLVAFMIHQCVQTLRSDGVATVSLCLCPAVRVEVLPNDSWLVRRGLQFGFNYASIFFDLPGEYHFKSRFRPRFVPRYICHWPHASVRSMWSLVRLSGVLTLDYRKLAVNLCSRFWRRKPRNLAVPPSTDAHDGR